MWLIELAKKNDLKLKLPIDLAISPDFLDTGKTGKESSKGCEAGKVTAYISPRGIVQSCSAQPQNIFGEVVSHSFMEAWTSPAAELWRNQKCTHCAWYFGD